MESPTGTFDLDWENDLLDKVDENNAFTLEDIKVAESTLPNAMLPT